jgi:hypothetical protein
MNRPTCEERTARALHEVAGRVDVTDADLQRLEPDWRAAADRRRPRSGQWLAAACALLVLALAGVALFVASPRSRPPATPGPTDTTPRTAITPADLVGLWRVDGDFDPTLWAFGPDGRMKQLKKPGELVDPARATTLDYRLSGTTLTASGLGTCSRSWTVAPDPVGLVLERIATRGACDSVFDAWWVHGTLTRLVPSDGRDVRLKYVGGGARRVDGLSALSGTWLLRGTGRLLAVAEARAGATSSTYVVTDRAVELVARGSAALDERGTVTVGRGGTLTFRPDGGSCDRAYQGALSDYATLQAQLVTGSCGRLGGSSDTWVRLD